jgi:serine phosphatase RsbU (regulator of sigma subunit)
VIKNTHISSVRALPLLAVFFALLIGQAFGQQPNSNSIVHQIHVHHKDTVYTCVLTEKVKIKDHAQMVVFHLKVKDPLDYALLAKNSTDTLWVGPVTGQVQLMHLHQGNYKLLFRSNGTDYVPFSFKVKPNLKSQLLILVLIFSLAYIWYLYRSWALIQANRTYKQKEITSLEVARQKEELSIKNKNITDSINYARRIQLAMIPSARYFKNIFPESFIFFKPKDIVSGDFFWIAEKKDKVFVAAVDCTGHGVPGAFMSIIGIELLRKLIINQGLEEPSAILNELNKNFAEIFKDVENVTLRDGMDVAFCTIDRGTGILEFAGAFNPLYLIRENKITEIKGDRFSVGLEDYENGTQNFTNHHIQLLKDDMIYIFTDGYSDQFGGPEGKKFKYRRFRHLLLNLHDLPVKEQQEQLERSMEEWMGSSDQVDDILIIGMKISF